MAMSNIEKQTAYRDRMYAAGYKQARIWVPRKEEGRGAVMTRKIFIEDMEAFTDGWSKARLAKLFNEFIKIIKKENKNQKGAKKR